MTKFNYIIIVIILASTLNFYKILGLFIYKNNNSNYELYYKIINMAEAYIVNSKMDSALIYYDKAFKTVVNPLGIDYHNALIISLSLNRFDIALEYSKKMILKGCELPYFEVNFPEIKSNVKLKHQIKECYPILRKEFEDKIDINLLKELNTRFIKDQSIDDPLRHLYFYDNIKWLKEKIKENSFPNEDLIGLRIENNEIELPYHHFFLIHWFDNHAVDSLGLKDLLEKEVRKGDISPDLFASLGNIDTIHRFSLINNVAYIVIGNKVFSPTFDKQKMDSINFYRSKFHLENFTDFQHKVSFNSFNKRFLLVNGSVVNIFVFNDEQSANNAEQFFSNLGFSFIGDKKTILNLD